MVESLSSYVRRISLAHGLSPRQLLKLIFGKSIDGQLNGYSDYALRAADTLQEWTGIENLKQGTLLQLRENCALNCIFSITSGRRWCPSCVAKDLRSGEFGYDPLIWSMRCLALCPEHDCELVDRCQNCQHSMSWLYGEKRLCCPRCGASLESGVRSLKPTPLELFCRSNLAEILSRTQHQKFVVAAIRVFLLSCIKVNRWTSFEMAERFGFEEYGLVKLMLDPPRLPNLFTSLQIAAACQQPLAAILDDPDACAAQLCFEFPPLTRARETKLRVSPELRQRIFEALSNHLTTSLDFALPSVNEVCRDFGVTAGFANYAFPRLVEQIADRRKQYQRKKVTLQHRAAAREVDFFLTQSDPKINANVSQKKIVARLMEKSGLPKRILAEELRKQLRERSGQIVESSA